MARSFPVAKRRHRRLPRRRWIVLAGASVLLSFAIVGAIRWCQTHRPDPGTLSTVRIVSAPAGAAVSIDGQGAGHTPITLRLAAGQHRVTLRRNGYVEEDAPVELRSGQPLTIDRQLWWQTAHVTPLLPGLPGAAIAGASFLADGGLALTTRLPGNVEQLWLRDHDGTQRSVGPQEATGPLALTPDGRQLASALPAAGQAGPAVAVLAADHGAVEHRVALPADDGRLADLTWAPDGRHLLAVIERQQAGEAVWSTLRLLDPMSGAGRDIATFPAAVVAGSLVWRADGGQAGFLTDTSGLISLCVVDVPSGGFHYLADLAHETTPLPFPPLAWSADGRRLAYAAPGPGRPSIGALLFGTPPVPTLFSGPAMPPLGRSLGVSGQAPAWRPDGELLTLAQGKPGQGLVLRAVGPDGRARDLGTVPLSVPSGSHFGVRWDVRHAQAIVAVAGMSGLGSSTPTYWLVQFAGEGQP